MATVLKDFAIARSYKMALISDLFFGFINLVVYYFISKTFGSAGTGQFGGAPSYFAFVAVGSTIVVVIQTAISSVSGGVRDGQVTGTLEAVAVQPITTAELALGFGAYPVVFAVIRVVLYILIADVIFGLGLTNPDWWGFTLTIMATGLTLAAFGILVGSLVVLFKRSGGIGVIVAFAMGFAGGAFFPISVLPEWLQVVGRFIPTRFAFDGVRSALFEGGGWTGDVAILTIIGFLSFPIALLVFKSAVNLAEARGTLSQY